jgi:hypothetical protein
MEFLAECINAGLVKDISTDLTFNALGHWSLSFLTPDADADFANGLPSCYLRTAPVQYRHRWCHQSCSHVHGHPDMNTFPPPENIVGISRAQLNERISETPSRNTRKRTSQLQSDMANSPTASLAPANQDASSGSGRLPPIAPMGPKLVVLYAFFKAF